MPATAVRPASPAQIRFLTTLVAERSLITALHQEVTAVLDGGPIARDLIDRVLTMPRRVSAPVVAAGSDLNGQVLPAPSSASRAGRMLAAGGIEATVTLLDGRHVTLKIRTRVRSGRGYRNGYPAEAGARTSISVLDAKIGWINVNDSGAWIASLRTRRPEYREAVVALFAYAAGIPTGLAVAEASRCGRCMRRLTDPVSIHRGVGPECFGASTGSTHVNRDNTPSPEGPAFRQTGPNTATITGEPGAPTEDEAAEFAASAARRLDDREAMARQAQADREFAVREREQEEAAFGSDPDYRNSRREAVAFARRVESLTSIAAVAQSPVLSRDQQRARDLISEALDSYGSTADRDFAMRIFDQLAAR